MREVREGSEEWKSLQTAWEHRILFVLPLCKLINWKLDHIDFAQRQRVTGVSKKTINVACGFFLCNDSVLWLRHQCGRLSVSHGLESLHPLPPTLGQVSTLSSTGILGVGKSALALHSLSFDGLTAFWGKQNKDYDPHFTGEEMKAQGD